MDPCPRVKRSNERYPGFSVLDWFYTSTAGFPIGGWLLLPEHGAPNKALILGHGYASLVRPEGPLPCLDALYAVPCFRGLGRSARPPISTEPRWHVLHDIDKPDRYILRGCVEDLWLATSALLALYPWLSGRIGYLGISFGGGIGALALAWETRIARGHLNVPTFGHQPLRLTLPTAGSAASVQAFVHEHGRHIAVNLGLYDAAVAARHIQKPMHLALALFDPMVPPPTQFAIYNALNCDKQLFVSRAGHFDYPERLEQEQQLLSELNEFFKPLGDDVEDRP